MPEEHVHEKDQEQDEVTFEPKEKLSTTQHTVTIDGKEIAYTATAGTLVLKEESGEPKAVIFFVAYTRDDVDDPGARPITFAFNGGPGSSSVWLHLGLFGPRRVQLFNDDGERLSPPGRLIDNVYSLLDVTDLVFVDPVTTGYSRATSEEEAKAFHAFEKDIEAVGEFIRLYTTRFRRWASPKYLAGESYGTTRAAGLAGFLQNRQGMYLNGIVLISTVLNFQTLRFDVGNDLPYQLFLPTYAATAWYHQQLDDDLQQRPLRDFLDEVEAFVRLDYVPALLKGDALSESERASIAGQIARYTGLRRAYVESADLRLEIFRFTKELLRKERRTVGRLDSRFTAVDRDAAGEKFEFDPSYALIHGPFTAMLNHYVRAELGFESDLPYEILTDRVQPWDYGAYQNRYVNVAETLRQEISRNPHLRVFVANGYYDLATPYAATEYTFDHLQLDPSLRDNITLTHYASGHMIYIHEPSLVALRQDLLDFGF
ncbi:MAG: S10 family peptidase [Anaerolineae bacterium]